MNEAQQIRVLVVDDSAFNRLTIRKLLERDQAIRVVGIARDGEEAIVKTLKLSPDLITLDLQMPVLDGFSFLRILMKKRPTPVIVISALDEAQNVFKALELGAVDFIVKPSHGGPEEFDALGRELVQKALAIPQLRLKNLGGREPLQIKRKEALRRAAAAPGGPAVTPIQIERVIVIGSSTGGPSALTCLLSAFPAGLPAVVAIAQHMPAGFTRPFAERLDRYTAFRVKEAKQGCKVQPGEVLIAPGGRDMAFKRAGKSVDIHLGWRDETDGYVPSVDELFLSAAEVFGERVIGVVLTGMGDDGMKGIIKIKGRGGWTIAEAEQTSVIYGMPKQAVSTGAVDQVLPLHEIGKAIAEMFTWQPPRRTRQGVEGTDPRE